MSAIIGKTLNERYRLDAEIGQGGMGTVYRAHDTLLDRDVAIKILSKNKLGTEGQARFLHEARAAARLNHPNVVSVYDAGEAKGTSFIVNEYIEGRTLFEHEPASLKETLSIAQQICAALQHAHSHGIVHRDLKPENVMITTGGQAKLADFGLARSMASRMTSDGAIIGTVFYLPPEQAMGQEIDGRADLYALGVILYELVAGRLPFESDDPVAVISQHLHAPVVPPSSYNADIPPSLDALIVQLLSKQPPDRPASAAEVAQALDKLSGLDRDTPPSVLLHRPEPTPLDQLVRGRLVGREREFTQAKKVWKQASKGEGQVLLVTGEPGVGKTPLVREIRAFVQVAGAKALSGECYAEGSPPYAPIAQIIREAFSWPNLDLPDLVLADLVSLAPDLRARFPDLAPNPALDPQSEQQRLFESVVSLVASLTTRAPLLLIVEDVQWADGGTLFLLRHLARRARSAQLRTLLVLTYREAELDRNHPLNTLLLDLNRERLASRIKLTRLDREQTRNLLGVMFQDEVSDDFLEAIYRETEGNPFFIEEVCKALIEEGQIYRDNGRWDRLDMTEIQIPQNVRLAIQSRVSRLPAPTQEVLRLAAVVGREFDFGTLQQASDLDEDSLIDALETAERAQLIDELQRAGLESFAFAHGLTMNTLRESVSGLRRRRLHRRVAAAIKALRPDDLEALAYHYAEAGDEQSALTYTRRAADRARQIYANEEAIRLYSQALALLPDDDPERFELLASRAQVYDLVARREEQRADVEALLALAEELDDDARRCDALIAQADFYLETELYHARKPIERAVEIARALDDPVREGHALRRQGYDARSRKDAVASRQALEAAAERFRQAGLLDQAAICLHVLSLPLGDLGEHQAALEAVEEALALSRQAGDRRQEATSLRRLAIVYMNQFQHAQALPFAEQALALHRELGDRGEECHGLNVLGIIKSWLGQPDQAKVHFEQALDIAQEIGSSQATSYAVDNMTWTYFQWQGEYEAALVLVDQHIERARRADNQALVNALLLNKTGLLTRLGQFEPALTILQSLQPAVEKKLGLGVQIKTTTYTSWLQAELGDFDQAWQHLERARELVQALDQPAAEAGLLTAQAQLAWLEGEADRLHLGLDWAARAIDLLTGSENLFNLAEAHDVSARLHLALDAPEAALAHSSQAVELIDVMPVVLEGFFYTHSRALRALGRPAEADDYLRQAHERVMLVAEKIENPNLRGSWLENVRVNRDILQEWAARNQAAP